MNTAERMIATTVPMVSKTTTTTAEAAMSWLRMLMKVPTLFRIVAAMPTFGPYSSRTMPTSVGFPWARRGLT